MKSVVNIVKHAEAHWADDYVSVWHNLNRISGYSGINMGPGIAVNSPTEYTYWNGSHPDYALQRADNMHRLILGQVNIVHWGVIDMYGD